MAFAAFVWRRAEKKLVWKECIFTGADTCLPIRRAGENGGTRLPRQPVKEKPLENVNSQAVSLKLPAFDNGWWERVYINGEGIHIAQARLAAAVSSGR